MRVYAFMQMNLALASTIQETQAHISFLYQKNKSSKKMLKNPFFWSQVIFGLLDCFEQDELGHMVCGLTSHSMCHAITRT